MAEMLGVMLNKAKLGDLIEGSSVRGEEVNVCHLQYANDTLI